MNSNNVMKNMAVAVLATAIMGCADKKETKDSSDFATSAIKAEYSVEVFDDLNVKYLAKFEHDGSSLELENGDKISVEIESESIELVENKFAGTATYSLNRTEARLASKYNFKFIRDTQTDADNSFVEVPSSFTLGSPTSSTKNYVPVDNKTFPITWDKRGSGDDEGEAFTLRYDFDCRHQSGTPSTAGSYVEKVADDGGHTVNLVTILSKNNMVEDYSACQKFNITAVRSSSDGVLDNALGKGSVSGSHVRVIEGSLSELRLL